MLPDIEQPAFRQFNMRSKCGHAVCIHIEYISDGLMSILNFSGTADSSSHVLEYDGMKAMVPAASILSTDIDRVLFRYILQIAAIRYEEKKHQSQVYERAVQSQRHFSAACLRTIIVSPVKERDI